MPLKRPLGITDKATINIKKLVHVIEDLDIVELAINN
jgi:hypothetical protein